MHRVNAGAMSATLGPRQPFASGRVRGERGLVSCLSGYSRSRLVRRVLLPLFQRLNCYQVATTKRGSGTLRCNGSM